MNHDTYCFLSKLSLIYFLKRFCLSLEGNSWKKDRDWNFNVYLCLQPPRQGIGPAAHTRALTQSESCDPLVCGPVLNLLKYTSQGLSKLEINIFPSLAIFSLSKIVPYVSSLRNMTEHYFSFEWWKITLCNLYTYFTNIFNNYVLQWNPYGHPPQKRYWNEVSEGWKSGSFYPRNQQFQE